MEINKNEFNVSNLLLDEIDKAVLVYLGKNARIGQEKKNCNHLQDFHLHIKIEL